MIPRKRLEIGWRDLAAAAGNCLVAGHPERTRARIQSLWNPASPPVVALSVRSGFDATLAELNWPEGSEVLVSAITIRDMPRILREHGLRPVPVDLNGSDLSLNLDSLQAQVTPRTRGILFAHLMGARIDMGPLVEFARQRNLFLFEDCAQSYRGLPETMVEPTDVSDVRMFSFGLIKSATALGGAVLEFRDPDLSDRVERHMGRWPVQPRRVLWRRILTAALLKFVAQRPVLGLFSAACQLAGTTHDAVLSRSVRSFAAADFFERIRRQPSAPLLSLLARRLSQSQVACRERRVALARAILDGMPDRTSPGAAAAEHTWWLIPILDQDPDPLIQRLWQHGFDATRGASSMGVIEADEPGAATLPTAREIVRQLVYLPCDPRLTPTEIMRLQQILRQPRIENTAD